MGYFSNGTEGEYYLERYCFKCKNWTKRGDEQGEGCPVMDLHILNAYALCNSKSLAKKFLDALIPFNAESGNGECAMYLPIGARGQVRLGNV